MRVVSWRFIAAAMAAFALDAAAAVRPAAADRLWLWLALAFAVMLADGALGGFARQPEPGREPEGPGCLALVVWPAAAYLLFIAECDAQGKFLQAVFPPQNIFLLALETALLVILAALLKAAFNAPWPHRPPRPRPAPAPSPRPAPSPSPGPKPEPKPAPNPRPSSDWAERKAAVIAHCKTHEGRISNRQCAKILGVSLRRATLILQRLVEEGVLVHVEKRGDSEPAYRLSETTE